MVEGDWGRTAYIGGVEHPVPTQFSLGCSWSKGELSAESDAIIRGILGRSYMNMRFPLLDPFEGARLEKYLRVPADSGTYWSVFEHMYVLCIYAFIFSDATLFPYTTLFRSKGI